MNKAITQTPNERYVPQRPSGKWSDNQKKCIAEDTLAFMFKSRCGERLTLSNVYKYNNPIFGRKTFEMPVIKLQ